MAVVFLFFGSAVHGDEGGAVVFEDTGYFEVVFVAVPAEADFAGDGDGEVFGEEGEGLGDEFGLGHHADACASAADAAGRAAHVDVYDVGAFFFDALGGLEDHLGVVAEDLEDHRPILGGEV